MKKVLALLLLLVPASAFAESQAITAPWSGLNNADTSILINDNEAQDLSNVDLTDRASGIRKRAGYAQFKTIGTSTWGVRGGYYFRDASANDTIIHANNRSVFESVNGAAYTAFVTTATAGAYWDFTDSLGYVYGANSENDELWRYDGTTLTWFPSHPKGSQVEFTADRLVIAGATTTPNTLTFCKASDPTDCTVGSEETDAFTETVGLPGQSIQAIKYACGGILAWVKDSFSIVTAETQYDGNPTIGILNTVGTLQPSTVVEDLGVVYWQGQDNHFYSYDCNTSRKLSNKIDVSNIIKQDLRSWATDSQSDFATGNFGNGISSTASPGDAIYSLLEINALAPVNPAIYTGDATPYQSVMPTETVRIDYIRMYGTFCGSSHGFPCGSDSAKVTIRTDNGGSPSSTILSTYTFPANHPFVEGYYNGELTPYVTLTANTTYWIQFNNNSAGDIFVSSNNYYSRGGFYGNAPLPAQNNSNVYDIIFALYSSTSLYRSTHFNIGSAITSWGPVNINNVLNDGNITYAIYIDSNSSISISDSSTWVSSQTVTNNEIPTVAVGPYVTWTALFTRTASTQTPTINDLTLSWYEGSIIRHWGTVDKDHRLIWSVAEGTATAPNVSYVYDPRFDAWLKYSFPMDAAPRVGDFNYFGDVDEGKVYKWPSGNTDAGSAIAAYWKSKDFIAPDPFIEKDYLTYSLIAKTQTGSNLDLIHTVNTSSSVTKNYSLTDSNSLSLRRINANFPSGRNGTFINFRFGNDDGDSPFEVYALKYDYRPRPWRTLQ